MLEFGGRLDKKENNVLYSAFFHVVNILTRWVFAAGKLYLPFISKIRRLLENTPRRPFIVYLNLQLYTVYSLILRIFLVI